MSHNNSNLNNTTTTTTTTTTTISAIGEFLDTLYNQNTSPGFNQNSNDDINRRPFVTLTFAQSLDGKIAGVDGQQLRLSGNQSMKMTHLMRARHDGILIGIGTLLNDDPQLTARNLSVAVPLENQPQPIILDTKLRTPLDCKLIKNYQNQIGKQPWLICARSKMSVLGRQRLEEAGARVIPITNALNPSKEGLDLEKVFEVCKINGINRLMIEGGSSIITSCLNYIGDHPILNILVVTVSPYMVGEGVTVKTSNIDSKLSLLRHIQTKILGSDAVFAYTCSAPE
ncbi:hypothetical protein CROQUDRAFT_721217 [Cronartium quercuum f. sp. fusiforme G11]|uniref:2,5-diamino-6-ribosylamino-4(3H)-pyrimidinone 5'-phosphate reductase n=1 Tax=Cronartium quercuum f. sp. fusiforme G11 TaxID=708437 RepID=A0A9P6TE48_9BASI|nr:hypothetical protein CROQUDRAFT_721217 [Cronartium quercuum f. sp. fusiforme G11]